jgi:predicted ArsR family transcriptional regulator
MTNKELADELGLAPGTSLRHVRELVATGFLAAGDVRTGRRGALERPYRSTGASTAVAIDRSEHADLSREVELAVVAAHYAELAGAPAGAVTSQVRWRLKLGPAALEEIGRRVEDVISEYAERNDEDAIPASLLWSVHRLDGAPSRKPPSQRTGRAAAPRSGKSTDGRRRRSNPS